jgi:hypothetical protein
MASEYETRDLCVGCENTGITPCSCDMSGYVTCSKCEGSGSVHYFSSGSMPATGLPRGFGSDSVLGASGSGECNRCDGYGKLKCRRCGGSGDLVGCPVCKARALWAPHAPIGSRRPGW